MRLLGVVHRGKYLSPLLSTFNPLSPFYTTSLPPSTTPHPSHSRKGAVSWGFPAHNEKPTLPWKKGGDNSEI